MDYNKTQWQDRTVEKPRTFSMQENADGTITLIPMPGTIITEGTPVNAANMNKIETGVAEAHALMAELEQNKVDKVEGKDLSTNDYTTTEKNKLAGIEAGATGDQSASEILTALKSVDGAGSGLDADLLDGKQPSTSATANTVSLRDASGNLTTNLKVNFANNDGFRYDDAANKMYLNMDGTEYELKHEGNTISHGYYSGFTFDVPSTGYWITIPLGINAKRCDFFFHRSPSYTGSRVHVVCSNDSGTATVLGHRSSGADVLLHNVSDADYTDEISYLFGSSSSLYLGDCYIEGTNLKIHVINTSASTQSNATLNGVSWYAVG